MLENEIIDVTSRLRPPPHPGPRLIRRTILSVFGPDHSLTVLFLGTHKRTFQWVIHLWIALARTRLTSKFLPRSSELPKGIVLGRDRNMHIRLTGSTPLGDHEVFLELTDFGFGRNFEVKRVRARAIQRWMTHWKVLLNKTVREWSGPKTDNIVRRMRRGPGCGGGLSRDVTSIISFSSINHSGAPPGLEAFWELTGFGFRRNSEVMLIRARAISGWVTHWKKQNREGVVGAQSEQYRATVSLAGDVVGARAGM
ncbi:hypothetical protein DVH24_030250 [Malus domestica]|uniref:Uncharacterized protein n=1 Tax=Malus domestica TaxID=3750 RepID=A0A498KQK3_MALDO|nr:hypothetical protein DVH24_030250 [Malus domestica]